MTYTDTERLRATAWKRSTPTLPAGAKLPAPYDGKDGRAGTRAYDFCLPAEYAAYNLLPEVREPALALFAELGIPWHAGVAGGPSNHLLSSQVQCVNALGQMVGDPDRIVAAFGPRLGVAKVEQIEPGRFLTFEYIGPTDFFHEAPSGQRVRGAHCTSVDAAFLHRRNDGARELVLVEWKYTESYGLRRPEPEKDLVRRSRYGDAWTAPDGPLHDDVLPFDLLLDEPFYQLMRQQLLAHELETAHAHDVDSVRVVHVLSPDNAAYQASVVRAEHRALGGSVGAVWQQLLRRLDRFVTFDPVVFLDSTITSQEYVHRYSEA